MCEQVTPVLVLGNEPKPQAIKGVIRGLLGETTRAVESKWSGSLREKGRGRC